MARVMKEATFLSYSDCSTFPFSSGRFVSVAASPFLVGLSPSAVLSFEEVLSRFPPFAFSRCWNLTLLGFVIAMIASTSSDRYQSEASNLGVPRSSSHGRREAVQLARAKSRSAMLDASSRRGLVAGADLRKRL